MFDRAKDIVTRIFDLKVNNLDVQDGQSISFWVDNKYTFILDKREDGGILLSLRLELLPYMYSDFKHMLEACAYKNGNRLSFSVGYYKDHMYLMHIINEDELLQLDNIIQDFINMYEGIRSK